MCPYRRGSNYRKEVENNNCARRGTDQTTVRNKEASIAPVQTPDSNYRKEAENNNCARTPLKFFCCKAEKNPEICLYPARGVMSAAV